MRHGGRPGDDAVSVVVGAVMLTGLVVSTLITVRLHYVPVWERDGEAAHLQLVGRQFLGLVSEVDRALERSGGGGVNPVSLADERPSLFRASSVGRLEFVAGNKPVSLASNRLVIQEDNGTALVGSDETWVSYNGTASVANVTRVLSLRLRVDTVDKGYADKSVNITITDGKGQFAGDFNFSVVADSPNYNLMVRTRNAASQVLYDQGDSYHHSQAISPYWVDALAPEHRFARVLASALPPFHIAFHERGLPGSYAITYGTGDALGEVVLGTGGRRVDDFQSHHPGGTLTYRSQNAFFLDKSFVVENGALVLQQNDGAVFQAHPPFRAAIVGNYTTLHLGLPSLVGNSTTRAQAATLGVHSDHRGGTELRALAPRFEVNATTAYPALWARFWDGQLAAAGLSPASGHYALASGPDWVRLAIYGLVADPASLTLDLSIVLQQAQVNIGL